MDNQYTKALLFTSLLAAGGTAAAQEKPNIILFLADDMGYGDVSAYNDRTPIVTPNLDRLCGQGIRFTDAHSNSAVSTPSRYGILTGRYAFRSELKSGVLGGFSEPLIRPERRTLADMLSDSGYSTAMIGKWHLGWDWTYKDRQRNEVDFSAPVKNGPTAHGFDYFYGIAASLDMSPYVYVENDMPTAVPTKESIDIQKGIKMQRKGPQAPDFEHSDVLPNFTRRACDYIAGQKDADKPYFLYLPVTAPHTPVLPSEEFKGKSGVSDYCDFVLMVDAMVGKIMNAVEESGKADNTIIIFTTDNGCSPVVNISYMKKKGHSPNHIFRGAKSDIYDGGHRIPLIISWGDRYHNIVENGIVSLTDFYATFADLAGYGLKDNEAEDSYSLMPVLTRSGQSGREDIIHHSIDGRFALRRGDWKLVFWPGSGGWGQPNPKSENWKELPKYQLFNMREDPSETENLYGEHRKIEKELQARLKKYIVDGRSTPGKPQQNDEASEWKQIEFLFK
ncbi:MAG: arylsulfatase [Candidatus Cryptobacteroides sp.]